MPENFASRRRRWIFNLFPAYRGTGRVTYISGGFREARVEIPLNRRSRNDVGTIFGGSPYGSVDPVSMILLIRVLGPGYTVWDKAAAIRFVKPGRTRLSARFRLEDEEIARIRELCESGRPVDPVYNIEIVDAAGELHASVDKTIHVRKKGGARTR